MVHGLAAWFGSSGPFSVGGSLSSEVVSWSWGGGGDQEAHDGIGMGP